MPAVSVSPYIKNQYFDDDGNPLAGGKLYTYEAGTLTNKATYSEYTGTTANANPIVLDSAGRANIFLESGAYDFVLKDSDDSTVWSASGISASTGVTSVNTVAALKALAVGRSTFVQTLGYTTVNDGGGWIYYYDSTSSAADDGGMVLQPDSLPATGRWLGLLPADRELNLRVYGAACDGTTDDISELQACDTWCAANGCVILVDSNTYFSTDPSLSSKVKLLPSAQLRWGSINPTLDLIIANDDKTQHFNCAVAYVPTLSLNELYPEWFGEAYTSMPITLAAMTALTGYKTKIVNNIDIMDTILNAGADLGDTGRTDDTNKVFILSMPHYDIDEENISLITGFDQGPGGKLLTIGGGSGSHNSVNMIFFNTADGDTLAGNSAGFVENDGGLVWGNPTGVGVNGSNGYGTINANAVYDDNVLLTGYVLDMFFNGQYDKKYWKEQTRGLSEDFENRKGVCFDVDKFSLFIEEKKMLPTFEKEETKKEIPSTGAMIQKLWEVVEIQAIHIKQLNDKINELTERLDNHESIYPV